MTQLNGDQLAAACELVETLRLDRAAEADDIISELCAGKLRKVITAAALTPAYRAWKRKQRLDEDHGSDESGSTDPDSIEAPDAAPQDDGDAVKVIIGKLLSYMGQSMLREKYVWRQSEIRLAENETFRRHDGPGEVELPDGSRAEWIICALTIECGGRPVRALPECRYRSTRCRNDRMTIAFHRLTCKASEANMKALASSVGALQYLYFGERQFPGHAMTSARRLAAALGITVANLSHHMRNMAGKAMEPGGKARFAALKHPETLLATERMMEVA